MSRWSVVIPGQPLTINNEHELRNVDGHKIRAWSAAFYEYRDLVAMEVQRAKPKGWEPPVYQPKLGKGLLVVEIDMDLARDMDCDNTLKALMDGLKIGLGTVVVRSRSGKPRLVPIFDDAGFLPRFMSKRVVGKRGKPKVVVTVTEAP